MLFGAGLWDLPITPRELREAERWLAMSGRGPSWKRSGGRPW